MKIGIRKPNLKKSFKAKTTGKYKRKAKKAVNPFYGKKGVGLLKDPKRSIKNKVYRKTTISAGTLLSSFYKFLMFVVILFFKLIAWPFIYIYKLAKLIFEWVKEKLKKTNNQ